MNEKINTFLLAGDIFMPEMDLRQPSVLGQSRFNYSACRPVTKTKEIIQKFMERGVSWYNYRKELHNDCFQTYGVFLKICLEEQLLI